MFWGIFRSREAKNPLFDETPLNWDFIRESLAKCNKIHGEQDRKMQGPTIADFLVIDVVDKCIVNARPDKIDYIALSYVWGGIEMLKNTEASRERLGKKDSLQTLRSSVPRIVQDAMLYTEQLSQRYLWVDSLCIVQDSSQKANQILRMGEIYGRSLLTIVAASSLDANSPLLGLRPGTRFSEHPISYYPKRKIDAAPITSLQLLAISKYEQRAWTFQERLMSTRCLVFGDRELVFFCEHHGGERFQHHERTPNVDRERLLRAADPVADRRLQGLRSHKKDTPENVSYQLTELVEFYSSRQATFPSDRLTAFAGVLSWFEEHHSMSFLWGLPKHNLVDGLFWLAHTTTLTSGMTEQKDEERRIAGFPSWSWVGWNSEIHFANPYSLLSTPQRESCASIEIGKGDSDRSRHGDEDESNSRILHVISTEIRLDYFKVDIPEGYKPRDRIVKLESKRGLVDGYLIVEKNILAPQQHRGAYYLLCLSTRSAKMENQKYFGSVFDKTMWHLALPDFKNNPERFRNVLLIEQIGRYAARDGMGVVHQNAWSSAAPQKADLLLM